MTAGGKRNSPQRGERVLLPGRENLNGVIMDHCGLMSFTPSLTPVGFCTARNSSAGYRSQPTASSPI